MQNNNFIKYLNELVSFRSITPFGGDAISYISDLLAKEGFSTEIKIFGNDEYKVTNLYAIYGIEKPTICFAGHVDVVPPGDLSLWQSEPFVATSHGDKIYGRGTVDMKGSIACALDATFNFIKLNPQPNGSISFLITSDEEGEAKYGTKEMLLYLANTKQSIDLAILGEPTSEEEVGDTIKIGRRGSINFVLTVKGQQGHVAYPKLANNPIHNLTKILNDLINRALDKGSEFFQSSNLEVTSIDVGNNSSNVIPSEASGKFNVRFNDLHSPESIVSFVKETIERYTKGYELTYRLSANVFIQKPEGLIEKFANIVQEATGVIPKFSTSGGTSDARFIQEYCPVVEFGLLSNTAHKINEYTKINDLQKLYSVYYNSLCKFLGETQ
jgi:succinyl-diaminopimelate desuccinylase